ncbi:DEAD/DEAH box helicase [Nakamurella lactea]|uniref:DEAD/DEAH box helicase n=1 Tax=Nakamurella lactea TaxID=459515 RepID=UPI00041AFCDA|nr:DEAD/DEAH box helicase family protein [Nakamurella lactea]
MTAAPAAFLGDGPSATRLRHWQRTALQAYEQAGRKDFLVTATPGAGKTTFALALACRLIAARVIDRVVVVCPTDHLRTQWADAAAGVGLRLDPNLSNAQGPVPDGAHGYVTTYAQVAGKPAIHAGRSKARRSLVILDEIHHAGDGLSWGDAVAEAFGDVQRRLCLTGTPFRTSADERIPFVDYEIDGDLVKSKADFAYGYTNALADHVVRPVVFAAYTGVSRWRNSAGEVIAASLSDTSTKSVEAAAWKTALDPKGGWVPHVIAAMDERITHLRRSGVPDAAGLVLASDQDDARAYAQVVRKITGRKPVLVLSDDPKASKAIEAFRDSNERIAVCVRMISEGVDIPRAACLAWMTSYRTPLFFAQAVGRVVRARSRQETATVFLPAVRPLLALAAEMETDRNYVIAPPPKAPADDDLADPLDLQVDEGDEADAVPDRESLDSEATFAHVLHSGRAVTAEPVLDLTEDDEEFLGLPGMLTPEQMASLLARRDKDLRKRVDEASRRPDSDDEPAGFGSRRVRGAGRGTETGGADGAAGSDRGYVTSAAGWRAAADLRREVNQLVGRVAARTGSPHAKVHAQLRRAVPGPASAAADVEVLSRRRDHLLGLL